MHAGLRKSLLILALIIAPVCTLHAASDLVVTTLANPPATLTPGTKFSLTSTVTNQGDASSPKTMIQYYLAPGPSKEDGWLLTGKRSVKALAPLLNYTGKAKITVPSGIPSGTYYLLACADDTNQAIEDNEDNNCTPSSAPVDLTAPDLVITDLSGLPATSPLKAVLSLTTSVKNEGTLASGPSRTYYYWSLDQTLTQAVRAAKQSVPPINPGEVSTPSVSLKAPKTPGTYYLLACADGANKVKEEDDENNCLSSSRTIIIGLPAISFSFSTDTGKIDSLPSGTTTINLTFDGVTREAPASGTTLIAFLSPDGDHTYSAQALSGTTILSSLGPISLTTRSSFPLTIPLSFSYPSFDTYQTDIGLDTPNTLIYFGTPGANRIVQYGGAADDLLSVDTDAGNDWIEQYGGGGVDMLSARCGSGDDYIYQKAGDGDATMSADGAFRNDLVIVKGGSGDDTITVTGGMGDDIIQIDAGDGNDSISVDGGSDINTISIEGGDGDDTLTVWDHAEGIVIRENALNLIYQSGVKTAITVKNIEQITVVDSGGNPIFTWP